MHTLSRLVAALCLLGLIQTASAQEIFVQVAISDGLDGCSILSIDRDGMLSEVVSNADILAATGETSCDMTDTGIVVASDGTVFFTEDESHDLLQLSPDGTLSVLVESTVFDALIGVTADADYGLDIGPDGNIYIADEDCDCILQVTPAGAASIFIENATILAATGKPTADLEGGIAFGDNGNLYFVDEASIPIRSEDDDIEDEGRGDVLTDEERVLVATPAGAVSVLTTEAELLAVIPDDQTSTDLDVDIAFGNGTLYVLNDGEASSLIAINPATGVPSLVVDGDEVITALGIDQVGNMDPEGGIGFDASNGTLVVGLDTDDTLGNDISNLIRITSAGAVSVVLGDADFTNFYESLYGTGNEYSFQGGLHVAGDGLPASQPVPTLSPIAMTLLALILLGMATVVIRRS